MENDLRFLRQQDAINMMRLANLGITLIGAGAIGSTTCVWLGKMGVSSVSVYDADIVQAHNWSSQMYRTCDIKRPKVVALGEVLTEFGCDYLALFNERYVDQPLSEVVISGVDSMESRKLIWKSVREKPDVKLYLDARMGLETLVVYAVRPQIKEDRVLYSESLCTDAEALQEPCTARTICYTPLMAASVLCNLVKRFVNNEEMPRRVILDLTTFTLMTDMM